LVGDTAPIGDSCILVVNSGAITQSVLIFGLPIDLTYQRNRRRSRHDRWLGCVPGPILPEISCRNSHNPALTSNSARDDASKRLRPATRITNREVDHIISIRMGTKECVDNDVIGGKTLTTEDPVSVELGLVGDT